MKNLKMYSDKRRDKEVVDLNHIQIEKVLLHNKWEDQMDQDKILEWMECLEKAQFLMMEEKCLLQDFQEAHLRKDKILDKECPQMVSDQAKVLKETQANLEDNHNKCLKEQVIYLEEILLAENDLFFEFIRDLLISI